MINETKTTSSPNIQMSKQGDITHSIPKPPASPPKPPAPTPPKK